MKNLEEHDDIVELGDVLIDTRGSSPVGLPDPQTGLRIFAPGIQTDD
jgi:hypothetical protein